MCDHSVPKLKDRGRLVFGPTLTRWAKDEESLEAVMQEVLALEQATDPTITIDDLYSEEVFAKGWVGPLLITNEGLDRLANWDREYNKHIVSQTVCDGGSGAVSKTLA